MSLKIDKVQLDIIINNDPARKQMRLLDEEFKAATKRLNGLKDGTDAWVKESENIKRIKTEMDAVKRQIGIAGMTMKELTQHQRELNMVLANMRPGTKEFEILKKELKETTARIAELKGRAKEAGGSMQGMFGTFTAANLLSAAIMKVSAAVTQFMQGSTEAFLESEKSVQRLGFAVKEVGGGSDSDLARLNEQAEKLKGLFDDEVIRDAQTQLLNYGLSAEQTYKLIPTLLDTSAQSGRDLGDVTNAVIRGMEGQARGLKTLGVDFKDTGDAAENLAIIQEKLQKFTGGAADALETEDGQLRAQKVAINDMQEQMGQYTAKMKLFFGEIALAILKGVQSVVNFVREHETLFKIIKVVGAAIVTYTGVMLAITAAKKVYTVAVNVAKMATEAFNKSMMSNAIGLAVAAISAAVVAVMQFAKESNKAAESQKKFKDQLISTVSESNSLFEQLKKTNAGTKERSDLIKIINEKYGEYLGNIDLEKAGLREIETAQKNVNTELIANMTLKAKQEEIGGLAKQQAEILVMLAKKGITYEDIKINPLKQAVFWSDDEIQQLVDQYNMIGRMMEETGKTYDGIAQSIRESLGGDGEDPKEKKPKVKKEEDPAVKAEEDRLKRMAIAVDKYNKEYMLSLLDKNERELREVDWKYDELLKEEGMFDTESEAYQANRAARNREYEAKEKEQAEKLAKEKARIQDEIYMATLDGEEAEMTSAMQKYDKLIELAIQNGEDTAALKEMQSKEVALIHKKYADKEVEETKKTEEEKRKIKLQKQNEYLSASIKASNILSTYVSSAKNRELEEAGDNEEKKKQIAKKYADTEMAITLSEIIASTAMGAINAVAQMPYGGEIMAALIIAEGAVAAGLAISERNKIKGLEQGFYPKYVTATREQDGKKFNARVSKDTRTQMVDFPTVFLAGERGKAQPEMMLDGLVVKDLQMNSPQVIEAIKYSANKIHGFEQGNYGKLGVGSAEQGDRGMSNAEYMEVMREHTRMMQRMVDEGVSTNFSIYEHRKAQAKFEEAYNSFAR